MQQILLTSGGHLYIPETRMTLCMASIISWHTLKCSAMCHAPTPTSMLTLVLRQNPNMAGTDVTGLYPSTSLNTAMHHSTVPLLKRQTHRERSYLGLFTLLPRPNHFRLRQAVTTVQRCGATTASFTGQRKQLRNASPCRAVPPAPCKAHTTMHINLRPPSLRQTQHHWRWLASLP